MMRFMTERKCLHPMSCGCLRAPWWPGFWLPEEEGVGPWLYSARWEVCELGGVVPGGCKILTGASCCLAPAPALSGGGRAVSRWCSCVWKFSGGRSPLRDCHSQAWLSIVSWVRSCGRLGTVTGCTFPTWNKRQEMVAGFCLWNFLPLCLDVILNALWALSGSKTFWHSFGGLPKGWSKSSTGIICVTTALMKSEEKEAYIRSSKVCKQSFNPFTRKNFSLSYQSFFFFFLFSSSFYL